MWHGIYVSRNVVVDGEPVAVDSMVVIVTVAATRKGSHPRIVHQIFPIYMVTIEC